MAEDRQPLYISVLSTCSPAEALSWEGAMPCWQLADYETVDGFKGVMAYAKPEHRSGQLESPLEAEGLCRIYLGINYTKAAYKEWAPYGQIEVKLTGDYGFRRVGAEVGIAGESLHLQNEDR